MPAKLSNMKAGTHQEGIKEVSLASTPENLVPEDHEASYVR